MPDSTVKFRMDTFPDASGHFGPYGGAFVPEILTPVLDELQA